MARVRKSNGRGVGILPLAVLSLSFLGAVTACSGGGDAGDASGGSGASGGADTGSGGSDAGTGGASAGTGGGLASGGMGGESTGGSPAVGACGELPTFEDEVSPVREVFVDAEATGSGDGSADSPHATLDAALADATPGTAIRIRPGTYAGGAFAEGLAGTAEEPIWIGGVPGAARPVIQGGSNGFQLSGVSFVVVHDLEVTGQTANGLNIDDAETASGLSHDLVFRGLFIHDIGDGGNQDCLKLSGIDDFYVFGSEFVGCSGGSAIDHVGCHRGVIARNTFTDLGGNGVQSKGGSADILITRNVFERAGERAVNLGGSTGFEFFRPALSTSEPNYEASDIRVTANVFSGGISPVAFVGCVDCLVAHNTFIDPEHWVLRILQETTTSDGYEFLPAESGRFQNNVVYYELGNLSTQVNVGPDTAPETFTFSNNLWYAYDAPASSEPAYLPVPETDGIYGEDPALSSVAAGISSSSPAAGAGTVVAGVTADVDGDCFEDPPAVGAQEAE